MAIGITYIRSGGQSGVDRSALDAARALGYDTQGWCPQGGWAEDYPDPPGLLVDYPELEETPLRETHQRTVWNVRDSDCTLIVYPGSSSMGTDLTEMTAEEYGRPFLKVSNLDDDDVANAVKWLRDVPCIYAIVNVGGPRESECPGVYEKSYDFLYKVFSEFI